MRKGVVAATAALVVVVVAGVGGYVYFFSNLRSSPTSLGLTASPGASPTATGAASDLAGTWTVTTGSQARYRVKELFAGQTAKHDAVAQTSSVSGSITVSGDASGYQAAAISVIAAKFTATSASVPGTVTTSRVDVTVTGALTIRGVTRPVTASAKAQFVGGKIEIAGSVAINMTDYGVTPPQVPFTTVDPAATIEFDIFLARA
jgi:polyisoprenoid-binding protein YceI